MALCPQGHLSVMAAQSVYDASMPRPSRDMVRGEILPSAWILQPLIMEGKEITRVIYLAQVMYPPAASLTAHLDLTRNLRGRFLLATEHPSVPRPWDLRLKGFLGYDKGHVSEESKEGMRQLINLL